MFLKQLFIEKYALLITLGTGVLIKWCIVFKLIMFSEQYQRDINRENPIFEIGRFTAPPSANCNNNTNHDSKEV